MAIILTAPACVNGNVPAADAEAGIVVSHRQRQVRWLVADLPLEVTSRFSEPRWTENRDRGRELADAFDAEETSLPVKPAAESTQSAVGAKDAMAGDDDGDRVTRECPSDSASRRCTHPCFLSES
jgi:hypothetical protein